MAGALAQIGCIPYLRGMILPTIFKLSMAVTTEDDCRVGEGLAAGVMKLKAMGIAFAAHRTTRSVCTKTFVCFLQAPFGVRVCAFLSPYCECRADKLLPLAEASVPGSLLSRMGGGRKSSADRRQWLNSIFCGKGSGPPSRAHYRALYCGIYITHMPIEPQLVD